jgi:hypothetical protein
MESCVQCGRSGRSFSVIAILNVDDAIKLGAKTILKVRDAKWVAAPICEACHKAPKIKAHFTYRAQADIALELAGSSELG